MIKTIYNKMGVLGKSVNLKVLVTNVIVLSVCCPRSNNMGSLMNGAAKRTLQISFRLTAVLSNFKQRLNNSKLIVAKLKIVTYQFLPSVNIESFEKQNISL